MTCYLSLEEFTLQFHTCSIIRIQPQGILDSFSFYKLSFGGFPPELKNLELSEFEKIQKSLIVIRMHLSEFIDIFKQHPFAFWCGYILFSLTPFTSECARTKFPHFLFRLHRDAQTRTPTSYKHSHTYIFPPSLTLSLSLSCTRSPKRMQR